MTDKQDILKRIEDMIEHSGEWVDGLSPSEFESIMIDVEREIDCLRTENEAQAAEIAALREARDALAGDAARDDGARIDATVLPHSEYGEWNQQLEAQRYGAPASAAPSRATDAAPERAATRLTRAQREALECIITEGGWLMLGKIVKSERGLFSNLERRGLLRQEPYARSFGYALTPQGRTALAAAQRETRDDARDASEEA